MGAVGAHGGFWTSTGTILVLFILLVIVSRTVFFGWWRNSIAWRKERSPSWRPFLHLPRRSPRVGDPHVVFFRK